MSFELLTVLLGGIATLAIYSFLIKENPFFRTFEHIFIGIAAGFVPVLTLKTFLWPKVIQPMLGLNIVRYPDGTYSEPYNPFYLLYLLPMLFGLLYYFIYSKRYSWLAKLAIGFSLGASGGLAFKGFFIEMMPQIIGSFKPLLVFSKGGEFIFSESINNIIFIFTLLIVMRYFFFTFKESEPDSKLSVLGRWLMMVCFGAFFGSTVMARLALMVERVQFLLIDWKEAVLTLFS
ncbi:MAG: hypothetical protein D6780_07140 [Candidatus Dadabacteria bacterium]|nr:MAG: hypothetical protein D6780_07140 [Candidatus Dadabacteria bacterium]